MKTNILPIHHSISFPSHHLAVTYNKSGFKRSKDKCDTDPLTLHFHSQHEIIFTFEGGLDMNIEGKEMSFSSGAVCIPPYTEHCIESMQNAYIFRVEIKNTQAKGSVFSELENIFSSKIRELKVNHDILTYLKNISLSCDERSALGDEETEALFKLVFINLLKENATPEAPTKGERIDDYSMIIEDFIYVHYTEQLKLGDVAKALRLSEKQTARIIKERYHSSFGALLNEKRMRVAASLLEGSDLSVSEIARRVLGDSEPYFYNLFKKKYGMTPLQYRKKQK